MGFLLLFIDDELDSTDRIEGIIYPFQTPFLTMAEFY